jgi:signal transduction histidine kinase
MAESPPQATRSPVVGRPTATLDEVDIRPALDSRPARPSDVDREREALALLASAMADNPRHMLQTLVEIAVNLCDAHTAGISLLGGDVFRWEAVAGVCANARGRTMPREESPCGVCIDRNATQLMHLADRCFPAVLTEPRFVEALLIPFHDHGMPVGTVWIVSHSVERQFDREDERIVRVLAQFVSAGWQLWKAFEAAQSASQRKSDFLATLGHELRGPFAAITTAASVLREQVVADERATRAVEVIARQSIHVSRLVDDLLDIERIASGKLELAKRIIDLRTIVDEIIESRRAQLERRRQRIETDLGLQPVWVDADPIRMAQVVSNLIDNASKYTPEDGQIFVATTSEPWAVVLEVRDTGVGVPGEQLAAIFEPFVQLADARGSAAGGLGLGLALVRRLAELHGGEARATSAGPGLGTSVTVRLPVEYHEAARIGAE